MGTGFSRKKKESQALQNHFEQLQKQMEEQRVTGEAGNGLVKITLSGANQMISIKIDPQCVDPEDVEGLELLVKSAYESAQEKLKTQDPMAFMKGF